VAGSISLLFAGAAVQWVQPWLVKVAIDDGILARGPIVCCCRPSRSLRDAGADFVLGYFQIYTLERTGQKRGARSAQRRLHAHPESFQRHSSIGRRSGD
jgi:hypothetical protein